MCVDTDCTCCNNSNYIRVKVESQGLKFCINHPLWLLKTISCKLFRQVFGYLMHSFVNVFVVVP